MREHEEYFVLRSVELRWLRFVGSAISYSFVTSSFLRRRESIEWSWPQRALTILARAVDGFQPELASTSEYGNDE